MKKIILASASPRRKEILLAAQVEFDVVAADIDETKFMVMAPEKAVVAAAQGKAICVADSISEPAVVIGADTVVYADSILGKPKDEREAATMLRVLSGREHIVYTGVSVVETNSQKVLSKCFATRVTMAQLTDAEISAYIKTGEPMDKAGAYAVQGIAAKFITKIDGCYFNVVGLPIAGLREMLKSFEIYI